VSEKLKRAQIEQIRLPALGMEQPRMQVCKEKPSKMMGTGDKATAIGMGDTEITVAVTLH